MFLIIFTKSYFAVSLYDLGQVMPYRLIAYWVGLQKIAIGQLEKSKPAAEAVTL
ncbi:hypothetical protein I6G76_01605 (plasmid) [Bacillus cereus]|uniref:hypothetical protein n=1 Tax=Bacillus cereus TaxID=1396 RepID=UPI00032439F7|nr:hypothetical protein [Bacillus cereus]AJI26297.1 hypothetical protein BF28_5792 [Bacillus cereus E33L]QQA19304.1 hypothetical protein I6G76_01605 [Bacillus cereus]